MFEKIFKLKVNLKSGDIIDINMLLNGFGKNFKGICISIRNSSFKNRNLSITLRNVIDKQALEFTVSLILNIILNLKLYSYMRKRVNYRVSKVYFLRQRSNRQSLVGFG